MSQWDMYLDCQLAQKWQGTEDRYTSVFITLFQRYSSYIGINSLIFTLVVVFENSATLVGLMNRLVYESIRHSQQIDLNFL